MNEEPEDPVVIDGLLKLNYVEMVAREFRESQEDGDDDELFKALMEAIQKGWRGEEDEQEKVEGSYILRICMIQVMAKELKAMCDGNEEGEEVFFKEIMDAVQKGWRDQ